MKNISGVSVILLSYNYSKFIAKAIESVLLQEFTEIELIITDDFSNDSSAEIIKESLLNLSQISRIKIKTRYSTDNLGIVKSLNEGLKLATFDYIFILASDDHYCQSRIKKTMGYFNDYDVDVIACDAIVVDQEDKIISNSFYFSGSENKNEIPNLQSAVLYKNLPINIAAGFVRGGFGLCFKKRILDPFGGILPENLTHEDDFISFLGLVNKGVLFIPDKLVYYRRSGNNISGFSVSNDINEIKKTISKIFEKQNVTLTEKVNYLRNNEVENPYYNHNRQKLIKAILFKEIKNSVIINYCNNESFFDRLVYLLKMLRLRQGLPVTVKYILTGLFPILTRRYIISQNNNLREIFIN